MKLFKNKIKYELFKFLYNKEHVECGVWYVSKTFCCPKGHNRSYYGFNDEDIINDILDFYENKPDVVYKINQIKDFYIKNNYELIGYIQ